MRRAAAVLLSVFALLAGTWTSAAAARTHGLAAVCSHEDVLCAGQHLGSVHSRYRDLFSKNGRFVLSMSGLGLTLDEFESTGKSSSTGRTTWYRGIPGKNRSLTDYASLTLQHDGNLVMRNEHKKAIWSSRTAGSGHDNRLVLQDNGDLVMRTVSGRWVWHTHTTPVIMVAGQQLASGMSMVLYPSGPWDPHPTTLTMTRRGDLVLKWGAHRTWHSGSHVAGSVLKMRSNGRLDVTTPNHRVTWRSKTLGRGTAAELADLGRFHLEGRHSCWQLPAHSAADCSQG